jgi:hypothetical protein
VSDNSGISSNASSTVATPMVRVPWFNPGSTQVLCHSMYARLHRNLD